MCWRPRVHRALACFLRRVQQKGCIHSGLDICIRKHVRACQRTCVCAHLWQVIYHTQSEPRKHCLRFLSIPVSTAKHSAGSHHCSVGQALRSRLLQLSIVSAKVQHLFAHLTLLPLCCAHAHSRTHTVIRNRVGKSLPLGKQAGFILHLCSQRSVFSNAHQLIRAQPAKFPITILKGTLTKRARKFQAARRSGRRERIRGRVRCARGVRRPTQQVPAPPCAPPARLAECAPGADTCAVRYRALSPRRSLASGRCFL